MAEGVYARAKKCVFPALSVVPNAEIHMKPITLMTMEFLEPRKV
jgi:hypothetical protein